MTVTARDICPYCGDTWDDHEKAETDPFWIATAGHTTCVCCTRVARRIKELNSQ